MKILQSLLYGLALAGPQQDDTEEMCGGVSRISKKNRPKSRTSKIEFGSNFVALTVILETSISGIDF